MTTRRKKTGPKSRGLTVAKMVMLTPKASRDLARAARDYSSEAEVIRQALDAFFLARNVRNVDSSVQSVGQSADLVAA
jgi:hypothetical protein